MPKQPFKRITKEDFSEYLENKRREWNLIIAKNSSKILSNIWNTFIQEISSLPLEKILNIHFTKHLCIIGITIKYLGSKFESPLEMLSNSKKFEGLW